MAIIASAAEPSPRASPVTEPDQDKSRQDGEFSDYIVFADESGDHGLDSIDAEFPVFALVFCLFRKDHYRDVVEPSIRQLKYDYFGHDAIVLHEREVRKQMRPFDFLRADAAIREGFYKRIDEALAAATFSIFTCVINKIPLKAKYQTPWNPYEVAMHFCLEKLCEQLGHLGQTGKRIHVLFEARGKNEDSQLELEFRRITSNQRHWGWKKVDFSVCDFEPVFVHKSANMAGHQISDLVARPIALRALRPLQENRAYTAIVPKISHFKTFP